MSKTNQRSQKLGAKAARRKLIVAEKRRQDLTSGSLGGKIAVAAQGPIERCLRMRDLFETGIGHVILCRRLPSQLWACALFLVDSYCLGVKDVMFKEMTPLDFDDMLGQLREAHEFIDVEPPCARRLLRDAVAYAAQAGLRPAKDYPVLQGLFGDVDPDHCTEAFEFGKDGKPFFIKGPNDTPARIREVTRALARHYGAGGWDYMLEMPSAEDPDEADAPFLRREADEG